MADSIARNDPCPCGSGKKYKKCCLRTGGVLKQRRRRQAQGVLVVAAVLAVIAGFLWGPGVLVTVFGVGALIAGSLVFFTDPPDPRGGSNPGAINFGR